MYFKVYIAPTFSIQQNWYLKGYWFCFFLSKYNASFRMREQMQSNGEKTFSRGERKSQHIAMRPSAAAF